MNLDIPAGNYVVAVSGGVDSMVLIDLLKQQEDLDLTVAHFDHGIRENSYEDEKFVRAYCQKHQLAYASREGRLGAHASEAEARKARYEFLSEVKTKTKSDAIITAHHKDDMLETAIINILRGTEHRGLASITNDDNLIRPLLEFSKKQITGYAYKHGLKWREDPSNQDEKYLRNYVRKNILPKFSPGDTAKMQEIVAKGRELSGKIKPVVKDIKDSVYDSKSKEINKYEFTLLPFGVASEIMREILVSAGEEISKKPIKQAVHFVKTGKDGKLLNVSKTLDLKIEGARVKLVQR